MPESKDTLFFLFPDSIIEYNLAIGGIADSAYLNFDNVKQLIYMWNDENLEIYLMKIIIWWQGK